MAASPEVVPSEGVVLAYCATQGGTYTQIAQILSVTPPGGAVTAVKKTHLGDTAQKFRAGKIPNPGELAFEVEYDPSEASHTFLTGLLVSGAQDTPYWWKITYPDSKATHALANFQAILTAFTPGAMTEEENLTAQVSLQVTGPVTRTAGS